MSLLARTFMGRVRPVVGVFGAGAEPLLTRRGSKNYNWYFRALEKRKTDAAVVAVSPFPDPPLHGKARAKCFIDVSVGLDEPKRIVLELADDVAPKTVENFTKLCLDGFKGTKFHYVNRELGALAGDVDGRGGHSTTGSRYFTDETFVGRHSRPGILTMANTGRDTNTSVFCITVKSLPHLDGRNVAFGQVLSGFDVVNSIAQQFHVDGKPLQDVRGPSGGCMHRLSSCVSNSTRRFLFHQTILLLPSKLMSTEPVGDAPRRLRIYTRTGDKGQSSLYNGKRESKAATVFSALGDTDELNANIGVAFEACAALAGAAPDEQWLALLQRLGYIQSRLLDVGSAIATPLDSSTEEQLRRAAFPDGAIGELERWIDEMELSLPVLRNFILPSGGLASAHLHVARTVCRRAEREVVALPEGSYPIEVAKFLNRLSDFLFVAARFAAMKAGKEEHAYKKGAADSK